MCTGSFGAWRFNEIVGFVRLHIVGTQIRGEFISAEKHRTPSGSRRKVLRGNNQQIFEAVLGYVKELREGTPAEVE